VQKTERVQQAPCETACPFGNSAGTENRGIYPGVANTYRFKVAEKAGGFMVIRLLGPLRSVTERK